MNNKGYKLLTALLTVCLVLLIGLNLFLGLKYYRIHSQSAGNTSGTAEAAATEPQTAEPSQATAAATSEPACIYIARADGIQCWADETRSAETALLTAGDPVTLLSEENGTCRIRLADGTEAYADSWGLIAEDPELEAARQSDFLAAAESTEGYTPYTGYNSVFSVNASVLNCRNEPSVDSGIIFTEGYGTKLTVLGTVNGFSLCTPACGGYFWCSSRYLTGEDDYLTAAGAVDLRAYLPEAQFELLFASDENVTGRALYPALPLLEETTAVRLKQAYDIFYNDGYILKIYDAYRPLSAQQALYAVVHDSQYIANPSVSYSWHQYGRAVDISLVDRATGEELEMPTPMHTFASKAQRVCSSQWSDTAYENVEYMTSVMESVGFDTIATEWWHFQYVGDGGYMDPTLDLYPIAALAIENNG